MLSELLVDAESLVIKLILVLLSDLSKLKTIVVIKAVDVIHYARLVCLDGGQDQKVLQILVAGEVRVMQDDALE